MDAVDLSIIISTCGREDRVVEAVESVLSANGLEIEVLVSDGSLDGSVEPLLCPIRDARVHYTRRRTPGGRNPALVRNERARVARGRYFYFLDDDDTALPNTLAAMVRRLDETGRGVAIGIVRPFGPGDSDRVRAEQAHYRQAENTLARMRTRFELASSLLFRSSIICSGACVIRRENFATLCGFDTAYPRYEDVAMYLRGIRHFGFDFVPQVLLNHRTGEPSLTEKERDAKRARASHRMMHDDYVREFGLAEYTVLKAISLTLPRDRRREARLPAPRSAPHDASGICAVAEPN